jgi:putative SOS response-associated peptidase YedK
MRGRFTLTLEGSVTADWFDIDHSELDLVPRYNIAPTQDVPTVTHDGARNHARSNRWGPVPPILKPR